MSSIEVEEIYGYVKIHCAFNHNDKKLNANVIIRDTIISVKLIIYLIASKSKSLHNSAGDNNGMIVSCDF